MFSTLLIGGRGEIVMRIARTCERMGIRSLAVHTEADATAAYLSACDKALPIAASAPGALDAAALVALAREHGADAIHPGSGALARDSRFAAATRDAGLGFVGSSPEVLERLSDDLAYPEIARQAGVRALPSCTVAADNPSEAIEQAAAVGYPLTVRARSVAASALAESEDDLLAAIAHIRDAAGSSTVSLNHRLDRPRLLSVHVVSDGHDAIALSDSEHSVVHAGRRVLEEAPAPALAGAIGEERRLALREAAVRIACEAGIAGIASADFELDAENRLYATGVRLGLPLEHALVEMCTRLDLVELQLRIASGEKLPEGALRVQPTGHAIQARIYAELPEPHDASPVPELVALRWPVLTPGRLRVDSDMALGQRPAIGVDPLLARVVGYGPTRHQAVLALDRALAEVTLEPLTTNIARIRELLGDESFRAGQFDREFTARASLSMPPPQA